MLLETIEAFVNIEDFNSFAIKILNHAVVLTFIFKLRYD